VTKLQDLTDRLDRISTEISALVEADINAVLAGVECGNSETIWRLTHEREVLHAAIERLRSLAVRKAEKIDDRH
jgi:hypothetical protein